MYYIVYKTVNKINNKVYIGKHATKSLDIFDGYLGDGVYVNSPKTYNKGRTPFHKAILKYGPENFKRIIIKVFRTEMEALNYESLIVNEKFVKSKNTYNVALGGGNPPMQNKSVYQYSLFGEFIKEWDSIKAVTDFYNVNKDRVRMSIKSKRSFGGSYWSDFKFAVLDITEYRSSSRGTIRQYTTDGVFIKEFKNTTEAAEELNISRSKITNAIYGKYATAGYLFLKESELIEDYFSGKIKKEKPIYIYNNNGDFAKMYSAFKDVKLDYKVNKNDTLRACSLHALYNGLYWSHEYYNNIAKESFIN